MKRISCIAIVCLILTLSGCAVKSAADAETVCDPGSGPEPPQFCLAAELPAELQRSAEDSAEGRSVYTRADGAYEVVIAGYQKKNAVLSDHEKRVVSYHEIGHALVAALQTDSAPVQKITIIPRTSGALGYTMQVEQGEKNLMTRGELLAKLATLTGGRAAEEVAFGEITTGASNDIEQATRIARAMIAQYGMTDEFDMVAMQTTRNQYLGGDTSMSCSEQTQREIDRKVVELVRTEHERAHSLLTEHRALLDQLAQVLYEKETITGEEFMRILHAAQKEEEHHA